MLRRVSAGMAASSPENLSSNGCDLVKLIAAAGSSCRVLRLWRGGEPYFCRPQVLNMLTTTTDKRLRAAVTKALGEEDEVSPKPDACPCFQGWPSSFRGLKLRARAVFL
jgi:hypothetical protein